MTEYVVLQFRDRTGRTVIRWYPDLHEADRGRPIATAGPAHARVVEVDTPPHIVDEVEKVCILLTQDPFQDLTHATTHHQVEPGGCIEPNEVRTP